MLIKRRFRLGVLGSGKGSNFVAIAEACARGTLPAEVALVLSDVESAGILAHARERQFPARYLAPGAFRTKLDESAERTYVEALRAAEIDLLVLAGFMRVLKGDFLRAFEGRIVNIHPSLLPSFPGLEAWKQALDFGVKVTGCTVHFVDAGVDSGPIIGQQTVPVLDDDTPEKLHHRIQTAEYELYPRCVAAIARGQVRVQGRRVLWRLGAKILLVEDDREWRQLAANSLRDAGYDVLSAGDAAEVSLLKDHADVELVVLDLDLGGENGLMLMRHLKGNHPRARILLYTGIEHDTEAVQRMLDAGAHRYVRKGALSELTATVQEELEKSGNPESPGSNASA